METQHTIQFNKKTISRERLIKIISAVNTLERYGQLKIKDWTKVKQTCLKLEPIGNEHSELIKGIAERTGYAHYRERVERAVLTSEPGEKNPYKHTEEDIEVLKKYSEETKVLSDPESEMSKVTIEFIPIPESVLEKIPNSILDIRSDLFELIQFREDSIMSESKSKKKAAK